MKEYNNLIDVYVNMQYDNFTDLDKDIYDFNILYDTNYYNGFNLRVKNFLDKKVKQDYIDKYADATATAQLKEIKDKLDDIKDFKNIDLDTSDIYLNVDVKCLKDIQHQLKDVSDADDIDITLYKEIKSYIYINEFDILDASIKKHQK